MVAWGYSLRGGEPQSPNGGQLAERPKQGRRVGLLRNSTFTLYEVITYGLKFEEQIVIILTSGQILVLENFEADVASRGIAFTTGPWDYCQKPCSLKKATSSLTAKYS